MPETGNWLTAVVSTPEGDIIDLEGYAAVGMAGDRFVPLAVNETREMPHGGELMFLPRRRPIVYNIDDARIEMLPENPYTPGQAVFPVAAFNSPGYVQAHICAYAEDDPDDFLPLFSYGAVGWHDEGFRTAVIRVDEEPRQDLRRMPEEKVEDGVIQMRKRLPGNRLRGHLERCALEYGCPAGKNFFLGRYEAPLPASRACNARCLGCLSLQNNPRIPCSQNRIDFTPSPEEIAGVALAHIRAVPHAVVSFGQGCEGDPLLAADVIAPAIRLIRRETDKGTINMNTNAGRPDLLTELLKAGLDSFRVSINSVRPACYGAYFRPSYPFSDVVKSIDLGLSRGAFVSLNYLNCPGFTDTAAEISAFTAFRRRHPFHLVQWRNLNFDPVKYWRAMNHAAHNGEPAGMAEALRRIYSEFPDMGKGYFNPPKERWQEMGMPGYESGSFFSAADAEKNCRTRQEGGTTGIHRGKVMQ